MSRASRAPSRLRGQNSAFHRQRLHYRPYHFREGMTQVKSIRLAAWAVTRRLTTYVYKRRLPIVVALTEVETPGGRFEVSNLVEQFRVVVQGGETEYTAAILQHLRL